MGKVKRIIVITGPHGSGKSRLCWLLANLIDAGLPAQPTAVYDGLDTGYEHSEALFTNMLEREGSVVITVINAWSMLEYPAWRAVLKAAEQYHLIYQHPAVL